jgi:hypothetical protein
MAFTVPGAPPPPAATLIAPSGNIDTKTPAFVWNAVATATHYLLWVDDSAGGRLRQTYTAAEVGCGDGTGTCTVTPSLVLSPGNGIWWIVTSNASGSGPWSAGMVFTAPGGPPPPAALLIAPSGSIATATPAFVWNAVPTATDYLVWIDDSSGGRLRRTYTRSEAGCGDGTGTCTVTPNLTLNPGNGIWWVVTSNGSGSGPWSAGMAFTAPGAPPPPAATLIAPDGSLATQTPAFTWNAASTATHYLLWLDDSSGGRLRQTYTAAEVGCTDGTGACTVTPNLALNPGNGIWWIVTSNASGSGPWSAGKVFTAPGAPPPGPATLIAPSGGIATQTPVFSWNAVATATHYLLWLDDSSGGRLRQTYTAAEVGCSGGTGTCSVAPGLVLTPGAGRWWIVTSNASGSGPWSAEMTFFVSGAATLLEPAGSVGTTTPTFVWNAVGTMTEYLLAVNDSRGPQIRKTYSAASAGCAGGNGTCTLPSEVALTAGSSEWWIVTENLVGNTWSSPPSAFTVPGTPPPVAATPLAPAGVIATTTPLFTWTAVPDAISYLLWADDSSGNGIRRTYTPAEAGCVGGAGPCGAAPGVMLTAGVGAWWIRATTAAGDAPWSTAMAFTVPVHDGFVDFEWEAPTTSADGAALQDLQGYRLYAGTSDPVCPGPDFQTHAVSLDTPAPGDKFQATLTNLTPGLSYVVRVSAVDWSGNESACTPATSSVARVDLQATPKTLSFGNVLLSRNASLDLTVQNVGSASITGTLTTTPPFQIIAGGSVDLEPNASQVVTVLFDPNDLRTYSANVAYTPSGSGGSRIVTVMTGIGFDP